MVSAPGRRGFTLIELTMAIVLLAIGLLALTGALAGALRQTSAARARHAALRQAEAIADSLGSAASIRPGSSAAAAVSIDWVPVECGGIPCVRVIASTATDTLTLLVAANGAP